VNTVSPSTRDGFVAERRILVRLGEELVVEGVSKTAMGVALMRAMHRIVDREPYVIDDRLSLRLFGDSARAWLRSDPTWATAPQRAAIRGHVLVRSAFAEDRLRAGVAGGVRQFVSLGAGYDTFPYRQPPWMEGVRVFEVDAPQTQADKRARLHAARVPIPANVTFVPVDFEREGLRDRLAAAGFGTDAAAFFSWLGVMVYLTRDAAEAVLRFVASLPRGSEIALTFTPPGEPGPLARRVAAIGEPLRTRISADDLQTWLRSLGFTAVALLPAEAALHYLGRREDVLTILPGTQIAAATV
jgi:methyltransferase (TIGR00027 family)